VAKSLHDWVTSDVRKARRQLLRTLSEKYFFRDPVRPTYMDANYFFAPADGVILYRGLAGGDQDDAEDSRAEAFVSP
jgi:phosphatidylserine decarboxylase